MLAGRATETGRPMNENPPRVGLLVTCLVDLFRPGVGFAAVRLLEAAGCRVEVPRQTCCGQPAYNGGDEDTARALARAMIAALEDFDHVVAPSGSCAGMVAVHYPRLFATDETWGPRARALASRTYELTRFLTDIAPRPIPPARHDGTAAYHDSCAGLRELDIRDQPRALLARVRGLELRTPEDAEQCCGFGGTFCVQYPDISAHMVAAKVEALAATGADLVLGGDLGCLLNIAGKCSRDGRPLRARHVAEILAGMTETPAIGEGGAE